MQLHIKPGDRMYKDLKHLIDNRRPIIKGVKLGKKVAVTQEEFERLELYRHLYKLGFLDRTEGRMERLVKREGAAHYLPGNHRLLEDNIIILYERSHSES